MPKPRATGSKRKVFALWKQGLSAQQIFDEHVQEWPEKDRPLWTTVKDWVRGWERGKTGEYDGDSGEKNGKQKRTTIVNKAAFDLLFGNIQDFANVATHVESEIERLALHDDSDNSVPEMNGRTHRHMWMSMKTVSHFNLGTALELFLKLLLFLNNKGIPHGHKLTPLYNDLPKQVQGWLEDTFQEDRSVLHGGCELIAFINLPQPPEPATPPARELSSLRQLFEYFDRDVRLWQKRYSFELVQQQQWHHYLSDLTLFITLMDRVMEDVGQYVAPEDGTESGGTGTEE